MDADSIRLAFEIGAVVCAFGGGFWLGACWKLERAEKLERLYTERLQALTGLPRYDGPPDGGGYSAPLPTEDEEATDANHFLAYRANISVFDRSVHEPDIRKRLDIVRRKHEGRQEAA